MWIVFALLAAVVSATVVTLSKAGIKNVPPSLAFAIQAVLIIVVSWGTVVWEGLLPEITKIDRKSWAFLITAGILTATSSLLSFRALSLGDASRVSPLTNVALVFSVLLAALFLKEKLTWQVLLGAGFMVAGVLLIATAKPSDKADDKESSKKNGRPETGTTIYESKPVA
ncbi:EamA family transporter [Hymenobacter monticola]|uniref:EamA family transporter n=1 Tax=Hymenobacter monticola TaxID=1705399 RepID=A0ABY4B977_9BACT|nr:EamA family transporter [Hymenobacter monticola]UOE35610.1 EamA family transporter [Hymenobacter monticola]